jgi:micrococcal nuclease
LYEYQVTVVDQHDGDTFRGDIDLDKTTFLPGNQAKEIDLGFNFVLRVEPDGIHHRLWLTKQPFRLNRINAPEVTGVEKPLGQASKAFVNKHLTVGRIVSVRTVKDKKEKYGRYLADIFPEGFAGPCLNDLVVEQGFAKYWDGQGARPI